MPIEIDYQKHINNSSPVREADKGQRREYLLLTSVAALFVLVLFFYGWQIYRWTENGYQIQKAQERRQQLLEVRQQLALEKAALRNFDRIESIARSQLGMSRPALGQVLTLHPDSPLTIPSAKPVEQAQLSAER